VEEVVTKGWKKEETKYKKKTEEGEKEWWKYNRKEGKEGKGEE